MTINFKSPEIKELQPRLLVVGVGGAGGNALNEMIDNGLQGVEFIAVNTDAQDLKLSKAKARIQIGLSLTKGLGAGAKHDIGQAAADESLNEIVNTLQGANMVFITAGMGGGTGTGAAHVIARAAKELNILTVGVVTLPFLYEGPSRMRRAQVGLEELRKHVDTIIVIPNQNLFKVANEQTTFEESFNLSNNVLMQGVQSVTDLMVRPGIVNLDFADVETVMASMGKAMMGTGEAEGEVIIGAITSGDLDGKIRVSIVATALDGQQPESKSVINMVHRIQNRNPGYSDFNSASSAQSFNFSPTMTSPISHGANALKLENEIIAEPVTNTTSSEMMNEQTVSNQEVESIIENNQSNDYEQSFSEEALTTAKPKENSPMEEEHVSNGLENFGVEGEDAPDLFSSDSATSETEGFLSTETSENTSEDDDLEIPAFLRRQKN